MSEKTRKVVIEKELIDGEVILWSGKPTNIFYGKEDKIGFPFILMFGLVLTIFGSVFAFIGFLMIFGKFLKEYISMKNTNYYVTNKRLLLLKPLFGAAIQTRRIEDLIAMDKENKVKKKGTIIFKTDYSIIQKYYVRIIFSRKPIYGLEFRDIKNVDEVYRLVNEIKLEKIISKKIV